MSLKMPPITPATLIAAIVGLALLIVLSPLVILAATFWGARELHRRHRVGHAVAVGLVGVVAAIGATFLVVPMYSQDEEPHVAGTTSTTRRPATTSAPSSARADSDWLGRVRSENVQRELVEITEVSVNAGVMRVYTNLGYAPADIYRLGMAAQVCFDAQRAGWRDHIEVWAGRGGILAWTGARKQGCSGY